MNKKAQNLIEMAMLASMVVIVGLALMSLYHNKQTDEKLANLSKVTETAGIASKPSH